MNILENYQDLVGKKIVFSHMAEFAEHITLATEDGSVLVVTQYVALEDEEDYEGKRTRVLPKQKALQYIETQSYLREELGKLGIFDIVGYKERQAAFERERREAFLKEREQKKWEQYLRLKKEFEFKEVE